MITKESARQIFNLHSQIEKSNEVLSILKKCKDEYEKNQNGIEIIQNQWGSLETIELVVPERFLNPEGRSWDGAARIYQISVPDAILVIEKHIVRLREALEIENKNQIHKAKYEYNCSSMLYAFFKYL